MANGDWQFQNGLQALNHLLDAHTTIGAVDGTWIECGNYLSGYLITTGLVAGNNVNLCASNDLVKPADATHGVTLAAVTSADPTEVVNPLPRWIKCQVTAKAAGAAVTAALLCRNRP